MALRFPRPFGKYVLLRSLAVGGMAEVFLARKRGAAGFAKQCVIKRLLPHLAADPQVVQMFLDEARIVSRLSHPNIVQIFDLGSAEAGEYFIAMEYVSGVDVQQILDAESLHGGKMPLPIALRILASVAEGLDHAHRATDEQGAPLQVVHRDVSPHNVVVSFDGTAKLLDFGIAKAKANRRATDAGIVRGKVHYMSPEQVQGLPLDARSDLFAVGTMLYELTTGHKPFDGDTLHDIALRIIADEPTAPAVLTDGYPDALADILQRALAKQPVARLSTARELQGCLDQYLAANAIVCTSHDVAAYLDQLFPGQRLRTEDDVRALCNDVTDPNLAAIPEDSAPQAILEGELSTTHAEGHEPSRSALRSGGRGLVVVVLGLVIVVAVGFWWLRSRVTGAAPLPPPVAVDAPRQAPPPPPPLEVSPPPPPPAPAAPSVKTPKPARPRRERTRTLPRLPVPPPAD